MIAWKWLVKDKVMSKVMPRNLAEVTERMTLPCSVMCQSGRYRVERWNKSFEVSLASVQPYSPLIGIHCKIIHRLLQFCGDGRG